MDQVVDNSALNSAVGPGVFMGGLLEWSGGPTDNVGSQGGMNPVACTDKEFTDGPFGSCRGSPGGSSEPIEIDDLGWEGEDGEASEIYQIENKTESKVEIWEMGKQLGFSYAGGKNEILVQLNEMEDRDKAS
ncbi:hypothetical protein Ancab_011477 [Ancistrocladus abbreviatus]